MKFTLRVWRQKNSEDEGRFETMSVDDVSPDSSFLEMLDTLNDQFEAAGIEPIVFDSDCREGICGTCGMIINGFAHGPGQHRATCQLYMREFEDGATLTLEPFRADAFPVMRDLLVDRSAFDRIQQAGGYISVNTGSAPDANAIPVAKEYADRAFDAAQCISCGACVATCKNASAMLFVAARVAHFSMLPQGQPERFQRVVNMVAQMDAEGFGNCTNEYECEAACPKGISVSNIALLNRDYLVAKLRGYKPNTGAAS
ncbi:MAG: succinate dehydrogenase/fumarate reductase iron-sulfur subunit [Myxococcales bacterium]|nr:succinate dehydrogenase/fumarate reductase iron-sulfur subunit [Myxococcales bacterium]